MKTLVFFGGARKKGNTMRMVNYLLENIEGEKEIVYCYDLKNSPCIDCRYCLKHKYCSIKDGMVDIYEKIEEADNIILAAPTYLYGAPGPMKVMLDRFQVYWAQVIRGDKPEVFVKKGAILVSGGGPRFENQFTGISLELADSLHVCNVTEVGRVLMDDADRMKSLDERPEIKEELVKIAQMLN
ncbi:MAG: iron-sulfur flavoprotein [Fusobacteria bacterium]|nr:MAG: iron-sulfur flavoprotein [Fusobacteriota bacterium]KAF0230198.1 MAG: iron-sulfur [Fusobacteriota bacterium]